VSDVFAGGFILFFLLLAIAGTAFWIWALVDAIRMPDDAAYKSGTKLIWVLVIVLTGWIGALIYVIVGRPDGGAGAAIAARDAGRLPPASGPIPPPPS
jgi:hypothetical protein